MSRAGQVNILGIEFQVWAGLSLALQFLRQPKFKEVRLESPKLQDFDVILEDETKYICEVKCWKRKFNFSDLDNVYKEIESRGEVLGEGDSLLIIAPAISSELRRRANSARFYRGHINEEIAKWFNAPVEEVERLSKVEFWETDLSNSVAICFSLIAELVEAIVSNEDLQAIVHRLIVEDFLAGSTKGRTISRTELIERVAIHRKSLFERSGHSSLNIEECIKAAKEAALNPNHSFWKSADLTAASINFSELLVVLKLLEQRNDLVLAEWNKVWEAVLQTRLTHFIVESFQKNFREENFEYITKFLRHWIHQLRPFYGYSFHDVEILELIVGLCGASHTLIGELLPLLESFIDVMGTKRFFVSGSRDTSYAREKLGQCLNSLYLRADQKFRSKIVKFILANFNLIKDEGEFWNEVAPAVYEVLLSYLREIADIHPQKFKKEYLTISETLGEQLDRYYKSKFRMRFKGWELLGGSSSWHGDNYQVFDHHFVRQVLAPALYYFYTKSAELAVEFAIDISSIPDTRVSRNKPDFLRRSAIPVLLGEYDKNTVGMRDQAFQRLCKLAGSRRGIPSKHEIIFQSLGRNLDRNLREKLLKFALSLYDKPLNPFVFKEVVTQAMNGSDWALVAVSKWLQEGSFGDSLFGCGPLPLIRVLINQNKDEGVKALSGFVRSDYFTSKIRSFDVYEWCDLVADLLSIDNESGITFLSEILAQDVLSPSHQILVFSSIAKLASRDECPVSILELLLRRLVVPLFDKFNWSQSKVAQFVTEPYPRQEILEVCEKVIKKTNAQCPDSSDLIVKLFSSATSDPSPDSQEASENKLNDGRMVSIQTVRGRCAWSLQILLHPRLRSYLPQIIATLKHLLEDTSAYVKRMACFPLAVLLDRRNKTVTEEGLPFLHIDIEKARQLRNSIEVLALNFLRSTYTSAPKGLLHGLAEVINAMRLAPNKITQELWHIAQQFPEESRAECLGFGLFQAEFRRRSLLLDQIASNPMLQHVIAEEDESLFFREELGEIAVNGSTEDRGKLSWLVMKLTDKEELENGEERDLTYELEVTFRYFEKLIIKYEKSTFLYAYMFIEKNISEHTGECLELYKKALAVERESLKTSAAGRDRRSLGDLSWAPFSFNGKIISQVAEVGMMDEALSLIEFILDYPKGMSLGLGKEIIQLLKAQDEPHDRIKAIFDKFVEHEPLRFTDRDEWMQRKASSSSEIRGN